MGLRRKRGDGSSSEVGPPPAGLLDKVEELREVLLSAGTLYGVVLGVQEDDFCLASEWRDWLDWVRAGFNAKVAAAGEFQSVTDDGDTLQEWLDAVVGGLDVMQDLLAATSGEREDVLADIAGDTWRTRQALHLGQLAELARAVEALGGEPLNDVRGQDPSAGLALLGAVEDSLALTVYGGDADHELSVKPEEMYRLLMSAREAGVWSFLDPSRPVSAARVVDADDGPASRELLPAAKVVRDDLVRKSSQTFAFYVKLNPAGRELEEEEREAVCERLRLGAVCLRQVARERGALDLLVARGVSAMTVAPAIAVMRMAHRSLTLALSDDPVRRGRAIAPRDLVNAFRPVHDFWTAPEQRAPTRVKR